MANQKKDQAPKQAHPFIVVLQVFGKAYMNELRSRNTLGYRAKGELANTARAVHQGIDALRNHDPVGDKVRARQAQARAQQEALSAEGTIHLS